MLALDHLVVAARSLDEGVAWCERVLGIEPGPGGEHGFMGTHNRLFSIASPNFPRAYFEIIAIDPQAASPGRPRWFDLDNPTLQRALQQGPRLIHWVARCDDIVDSVAALKSQGHDAGEVLAAERETPRGILRWQIAVRADGARLCDGAWPTLIQWGNVHPADTMPARGVSLVQFSAAGLPAGLARALPPAFVPSTDHGTAGARQLASISATLQTPRGPITLQSMDNEVNDVQH